VGAENRADTSYTEHDWQCDINAAHPAAMLTLTEVPAFGHFDEVEVYDEHPIEAHTMYIIDLQSTDRVDPFLNADVTPVLGSNYLKYLQLVEARAAPHVVTHFVRPSRIIRRCHVPHVVQATLSSSCDALLAIPDVGDCVRKFKKSLLVTVSGLMQQRHSDNIAATIVTSSKEAAAVGGRIVPVSADIEQVVAEMREGGLMRSSHIRGDNVHLCMKWKRSLYKDGYYALALHVLDYTRLRVLEMRNALQACGATDFAYQCDAVFYKGPYLERTARARFPELFGAVIPASADVTADGISAAPVPGTAKFKPAHTDSGARAFSAMQLKRSRDALPPDLRIINTPAVPVTVVRPLWHGLATSFSSLQAAEDAWTQLSKSEKQRLWPEICAQESPTRLQQELEELRGKVDRLVVAVTGQHGGCGKSYCVIRAATAMFETGVVLTSTNSLRTAYPKLPRGWSASTYDRQLHLSVGESQQKEKARGSLGLPAVGVVILEEAAYVQLGILSMVLAAAEHKHINVITTYDVHQLQPVQETSNCTVYSVADDVADRAALLQRVFPTSLHIFARKRDATVQEQILMDSHLLYILGAGSNAEAQRRTLQRFGCNSLPTGAKFHLAYTRECARYNAFQELRVAQQSEVLHNKACVLAGKYHKISSSVIHKNHLYTVQQVTADSVTVTSAFDAGASLPSTQLPLALAELIFDPPGASTVHAVQGRTVTGALLVHEITHKRVTKQWLYTAVSRGCGPQNVCAIADAHRSTSDMNAADRKRWAASKAAAHIRWDVLHDKQPSSTAPELAQLLLTAQALCTVCKQSFVWARCSEQQPTLDRVDDSLGHATTNIAVNCLRCNRERGSGRGNAIRKAVKE
jgi:hypothetical protein